MSDHYITFIPADPRFIPNKAAQRTAASLLRAARPDADEIKSETEDKVVFRDCGENFERVQCPACSAALDVETWQELMDADYSEEHGFRLDPLSLPCCEHKATLNDLHYDWAQGFSRFALTAMNAGGKVPKKLLAELESALGCKLRVVYQMI
jgi:hypothetical protein